MNTIPLKNVKCEIPYYYFKMCNVIQLLSDLIEHEKPFYK